MTFGNDVAGLVDGDELVALLLEDIDLGYISAVMVKDLSRLGRDYVSVGHYTDIYFPEHNVRFIAVNDMVDSADGENELAPFKNIMNEMYARDISRKCRSSHRLRGNMGIPLAQPPYGHRKDPNTKGKWIVDPEPAEIVRRIFRLFLEGNGVESIAHILQEEQVMIPLAYWFSQGLKRGGRRAYADPCHWNMNTVLKILRQQEYCGDVINFKTYSKSFKNKKRLENDPENWKVFHDVHEPIIDRETFDKMVRDGQLLEHATYVSNGYGTPKAFVEEKISQGMSVISDIDVQGGKQIKAATDYSVLIFIITPTMDERRKRLEARGTETEDSIKSRLERAKEEYAESIDYDYIIVNDDGTFSYQRCIFDRSLFNCHPVDKASFFGRICFGQNTIIEIAWLCFTKFLQHLVVDRSVTIEIPLVVHCTTVTHHPSPKLAEFVTAPGVSPKVKNQVLAP